MDLRRKLLFKVSFTVFLLTLFSCATIFYGTKQKIRLDSNPAGAKIIINGRDMGLTTPATVKLKRRTYPTEYNDRNEYCFTFKKEGYEDYSVKYRRSVNNGIFLNFISIAYFPVGFGIDFVSGAWMEYPEDIYGNLNTKSPGILVANNPQINSNPPAAENFLKSDVDENIPVGNITNSFCFALIIGNEDYSSFQTGLSNEVNVSYAINDARVFQEYAKKTLGIPEENIIYMTNAKTVEMNRAINKLCLFAKSCNGKAELYFYYAGHGLPDETNKEAYIMPVDVSGADLQFAVKLKDLYTKLAEFPTKKVTVFLDACFSGGARNHGLVAARGVKIKPKDIDVQGNLVVFSASSGEQSSLPYKNKFHGMFTYFLLKKMQESAGDVKYSELSKYLSEQVNLNSIRFNDKEQNPQIVVSPQIIGVWENWTLK